MTRYCFSVSLVSQFMHSPKKEHLEAVFWIVRYLKGSPCKGLFFVKNSNQQVEVYVDANWAGSVIDRKSTIGYCAYVWGNLVTWKSKKQNVVARWRVSALDGLKGLMAGCMILIRFRPYCWNFVS